MNLVNNIIYKNPFFASLGPAKCTKYVITFNLAIIIELWSSANFYYLRYGCCLFKHTKIKKKKILREYKIQEKMIKIIFQWVEDKDLHDSGVSDSTGSVSSHSSYSRRKMLNHDEKKRQISLPRNDLKHTGLTLTRPIGFPLTRSLRRKLRISAESSLIRQK